MVQPCNFLAPNGEKSDLAQSLIEQHGPDKALSIWDTLHSTDVLEHIHDWKSGSKYVTEKGELNPGVATYIHNIFTARNEWNTLRADAALGKTKVRKEYYHPSAERLVASYEGARILESKDTYDRLVYKVVIPLPKFDIATADRIVSGEYQEAMKAPIDYITPEIPEKEIQPKLDNIVASGLAKGTENTFTQKSNYDMAQGDKAMVYIGGKPLIATYLGESSTIKGAHSFQVSNPYSKEAIASQELGLSSDTAIDSLASDSTQLQESLGRMFAQVRDTEGNVIPGQYFTSEQQNNAVDAVLTDVHGYVRNSLKNGDNLTANLLLSGLKMTKAKLIAFDNGLQDVIEGTSTDSFLWNDLSPEDAQVRSMEIQNVIRSYDQVAGFALERMKAYGFNIKESIVGNITEYLRTRDIDNEDSGLDQTQDVDITGSEGRGLKDWTDSSFELDPRDTASKRMKFWLATIKDAEFGKEEPSKRVRMIFADPDTVKQIINGSKVYTVRTPEQAERIKLGVDGKGSIVLDGKIFTVEEHKYLPDEEALSHWTDVFEQEKLSAEPGSVVYKLSKFEPKENVLVNKKSALGFPKLAPFDQTFTDILARVQDAPELTYKSFQETLAKSGSPTMMRVAQEIEAADQQLKNEFFKVMSKQYQRMRTVLFSIRQRGTEQIVQGATISSNRFNEVDTLISGWREQQKVSPLIVNKDGKLGVNAEIAQTHLEQFKKVTQFDWNKATVAQTDKLAEWTKQFLSDIGINITDEAMRDFRTNAITLTKGTQFTGSWFKQYSMTTDGKPNGVIAALVLRLTGLAAPDSQIEEQINPEEEFLRNNNPLYTENTAIRILAKSQAKFAGSLFAPMHKNAEGKSIYAYGLRTYESHTFNQLKNSEEYRNQYQDIPFSRNAWLLSKFNNATQREKMELNYLDALKASYRKGGGTTRPDMSPREQEAMAIWAFQNRGNKYATFLDMTKSDKSTTPIIFGVEKEPVKGFTISTGTSKAYGNVFQSEFDRIRHWEDNKESFNNKNYVAGGGLFYLMPQFNFEEMSKDLQSGKISRMEFNSVWNDNGTIARTEDVVTRSRVAEKYTTEFIKKETRATTERWRKMGIFDEEQMKFDDSWVKKARRNLLIGFEKDAAGVIQYNQFKDGSQRPIGKAEYHNLIASLAALEFSTHYFLHNTSMSQLISDDPAMAYKGKKGTSQLEQVEATMKEYQKRLAKDIAPGSDPSWDRNTTYKSLTIQDPNYRSYLGEIIPAYKSFDTAGDAQEITTTQEHLDTMYAEGRIPDKIYHEMSDIIKEGIASTDHYYEFTKPEHKNVVMQAMKPVQVGAQFGNGIREVHYIKTSSYPLLPELTRDQEIDGLRRHMEDNGVQRTVFKSGKKLGSPNEAAAAFGEDGKFLGLGGSEDAVQTLKRDGFRIQQEVPYDEEKGKILTVSQMNKLITEGIGHMEGFILPGHENTYTGEDIRAIKEHIRTQMFDHQRHQYLRSVGATPNANGTGYHFADQTKMLKALEHEAVSRNYPLNDLDAIRTRMSGGKLVLPLFLNGSADKFESLMMSLVKQIVTVKMPGKSFIQASSLGYKGHELYENLTAEQKEGIIYTDDFDPKQGLRSLQKGEGVTKAAQVFVPFNFLGTDGKPMDVMKFTKKTEDGRTVIDNEKLPAELRRFVGARIPNQEHSSMLPIEIVGFIPKQMGDLMIVPAEITQQMGSDFDVDKLYVYRPGYKQVGGILVGTEPHRPNPEGEDFGPKMDQLRQQYFDVHWSVLTHPEMFNRILNPLDKPELKNEKLLAEARLGGEFRNYYTASKQFDDFMSQKDAKVLVGATAVNNTFNAIIQDKNLRLGHVEMTETGPKEVEDSINFADEKTGTTLRLSKLSGVGTSEYFEHENPDATETGVVRTKANNISSQLSEVVDHAKNRTIDYLNLNQHTFPASAAMTLLETSDGQALNLKYNSRLLQQEVVVDYANRMQSGNDSLSSEFTQNLKDKVFADLSREYRTKAGESFDPEKKMLFSPQSLLELLNTKPENRDEAYYGKQYHALELFRQLEAVGTTMREIQSKFNQDTRGAGSDLLASLNTQADLPRTINNGTILGVEEIGGNINKEGQLDATTETGSTFKNTIEVANSLYPELLPYQKLQPLFGSVSIEMGRNQISTDNQRRIADAVKSNLLASSTNGLYESATKERARLLFDTEAGPSLARRIADAQSTWGRDDYLLARLATHIASRDDIESTVTYNATGASSLDDFEITKAWAAMLTSPDVAKRALAEDLIRYTYATGGLQTAQNLSRFVPIGYLAGLPMAKELNHQVDTLERFAEGPRAAALTQQLFQHNPDMALQMKGDFSQTREHPTMDTDRIPERFTLEKDVTNTELPSSNLVITAIDANGKPTLRYPDFLSARGANSWLLYRRTNEVDGATEFQRIDLLGKGDILEYDPERAYARSVFPENRALYPLSQSAGTEMPHTPAEHVRDIAQGTETAETFGITPEGSDYNEVISNMLTHPDISQESQSLLSALNDLATFSSRTVSESPLPKIQTTLDSDKTGMFNYAIDKRADKYFAPRIALNLSQIKTPQDAVRVMTHELTHYNTGLVLRGYEDYMKNGAGVGGDKPAWLTPEVSDAIHSIDMVRIKAQNEFEADASSDKSLAYAFSSSSEFISAVFENKKLQQLLNSKVASAVTSKSVLQQVIEGLQNMMRAIGNYMGIGVKEGSMLDESIRHSMIIMGAEVETIGNMDTPQPKEERMVPEYLSDVPTSDLHYYQLKPGVFVNREQRTALDSMHGFLASNSNYYMLSGAGGTGKTSIIGKLLERAIESGEVHPSEIGLYGLTHSAALQLGRALDIPGVRLAKPGTLHSGLGIVLDQEASEGGKQVFRPVKEDNEAFLPRVSTKKLIIIDEASMMDDSLFKHLNDEVKRSNSKVIFMGDHAQLEPVGQTEDAWPIRKLMGTESSSMLVANMRTSHKDVVDLLQKYRDTIGIGEDRPTIKLESINPLSGRKDSTNVTYEHSAGKMIDGAIDSFHKAIEANDPYKSVVVTYTNKSRESINTAVRRSLFGKTPEIFEAGDLLIINKNYKLSDYDAANIKQRELFNMQRAFVKGLEDKVMTIKVGDAYHEVLGKRIELATDSSGKTVTVNWIPKEEKARLLAKREYDATNKEMIMADGSRMKYGDYVALRNSIEGQYLDSDYGYAVTSHKVQGASYGDVYVNEQDITNVNATSTINRAKSLYTALSRTKDHLTVFNTANPEQTSHSEAMTYFDTDDTQSAHSKEIGAALSRLLTLKNKIQAKQTLPTDRKMTESEGREYQLRGAEINRLEHEIQKLTSQSTLASLIGIGSRQMKTIDSMLTEPKLSTKQLENLLDTADTWEHMIDDVYDSTQVGTVPQEAQVLRGQAAERKARIMNLVKQNEINNPESVINSLEDFSADQMKAGVFKAYAVDLSRTGSMVAQRIDDYLKTAARLTKEENRRDRTKLNEYQAKLAAYAKKLGTSKEKIFDSMLQKGNDKWGLVNMFSNDYYDFKQKVRGSLFTKLKLADTVEDPSTKAQLVKDAYTKYRDVINKNVVYVDTSKLFDDKTGDLVDGPEATKHREYLEGELGKDLADTMIEKAKDNFQEYLRDRYSYKTAIQVQVQTLLEEFEERTNDSESLTPDEKSGRIAEYKAELTTRFNDEFNTWEGHHSPNVFFRSMRGEYRGFNPKFNNWGSIVDAPRAGAADGKFYDADFKHIQNDPELRDIYNFAKDSMDKYKSYLPSYITERMNDTFLPITRKEVKLGKNIKELKGALKEKMTNAVSMEDSLVEWARTDTGMVPIRYVNPKGVEVADRERNIFRMLEKFGQMATHYKRAIEVQSGVELLHRIMVDKIQDTKGGVFDRVNNGTKNLSDMVAYAKDKLLYEKSKVPEGELGNLYSLNPVKQFKLEREIVNYKDKLAELDDKYAEGKIDPQEYMDQKMAITQKIDSIPHSQILASKLGDVMIKMTELKTLSYNPFSAFANLSFGLVSLMVHANGRVDFDKKTAMNAFTTMLSATKRAVTGGLAGGEQAKKILVLMEKYDMMGDLLDSDFAGQSRIHGQKTLLQRLSSPYQLLRNSDYFMKGSILVAMLKSHKVMGGEGKEVSLWDAYDSKGEWKGESNKEWVSENPEEEVAFRKFQARAIQVGKTIMGNQDHPSTTMIKRTVLGRLVSQFRGTWLSEGFNARFEDERFDSQLGRQVKGRYRTYSDLGVVGSMTTLFKQGMSTFLNIDPFTGRKRNGEKLNDVDIENMRRNFAEAASYLTVMAAIIALRQQMNKDDDNSPEAKRDKAIGKTLLNLVIRNRQDIEFFGSPDMVTNITSSLVPAMKVWVDFNRATKGTIKYLGQSEDAKNAVKGSDVVEKWMKTMPYTSIYGKFKTMWSKDADSFTN